MAEVLPETRQGVEELLDMDVDADGAQCLAEGVGKRGREEEGEGNGEEAALSKRPKVAERSVEEERMGKLGGGECLEEEHGVDGEREGAFKEEAIDGDGKGEDGEQGGLDVEEAVKVPAEVSVGPKTFTSSVEMFDYFYNFLQSWSPDIDVNKYEHMVLLDLLKKGHPEPETKIGEGVKAFQVRFHPKWRTRCFFVIRINGSSAEFSFRKCVDSILPLPEEMKAKTELTFSVKKHINGDKDQSSYEGLHGGSHHLGGGGRGRSRGRGRRGGFRR